MRTRVPTNTYAKFKFLAFSSFGCALSVSHSETEEFYIYWLIDDDWFSKWERITTFSPQEGRHNVGPYLSYGNPHLHGWAYGGGLVCQTRRTKTTWFLLLLYSFLFRVGSFLTSILLDVKWCMIIPGVWDTVAHSPLHLQNHRLRHIPHCLSSNESIFFDLLSWLCF